MNRPFTYGSVCSGIEAATSAWHHMGWKPAFFSEIEPFPSAILKHHYPNTPNYGDLTQYKQWPVEPGSIDLLVGGTPCQSFSVAGLRKGLSDPRGNLCLTFLGLVDHLKPQWVLWENVPGVLSSGGGRDFGSFLGALGALGYGYAYRVLDAQYFGVAQRRRRVFVVGYLGDWRCPAEVLSIAEGMCGHPAPVRKTRKGAATGLGGCPSVSGTLDRGIPGRGAGNAVGYADHLISETIGALCAVDYKGSNNQYVSDGKCVVESTPNWRGSDQANAETLQNLAGTLNCNGGQSGGLLFYSDLPETAGTLCAADGKGKNGQDAYDDKMIAVPRICINKRPAEFGVSEEVAHCLRATDYKDGLATLDRAPIAFAQNTRDEVRLVNGDGSIVGALAAESGMKQTSYIAEPIALAENTIGRQPQNGGNGDGFTEGGPMYTLNASGVHGVAQPIVINMQGNKGGSTTIQDGTCYTLGASHEAHAVKPILSPTITATNDPSRSPQSSEVTAQVAAVFEASQQREVSPTITAKMQGSTGWAPYNEADHILPTAIAFEPGLLKRKGSHHYKEHTGCLRAEPGDNQMAVAVDVYNQTIHPITSQTMRAGASSIEHTGGTINPLVKMAVRRLTPTECERLQGFPDGHTLIPWKKKPVEGCPDGPRYKALGNSMAVPVMRWIGERIQAIEECQ